MLRRNLLKTLVASLSLPLVAFRNAQAKVTQDNNLPVIQFDNTGKISNINELMQLAQRFESKSEFNKITNNYGDVVLTEQFDINNWSFLKAFTSRYVSAINRYSHVVTGAVIIVFCINNDFRNYYLYASDESELLVQKAYARF